MKIYFSVNSPKIGKREINRGEDAPPINKDGIMIICDGTGATGQTEHVIENETYTSAYLGSRETSRLAEIFLSENYDRLIAAFEDVDGIKNIVTKLGETIRNGLNNYVQEKQLTRTVHGKSFKLLPTTFTSVVYKIYETHIEAIVLYAGDSRALWWDTDGLHQLTNDDNDNKDISVGDCSVSNCIAADSDFSISFSCYKLPPKGILLASSDGFTDPIKPFEQEKYLIEWIGNFKELSEENAQSLSEAISQKMDDIGFTKRDDCSISGIIVGYASEDELKDEFIERYKDNLIETYIKPYKELNELYYNTETEYNELKENLYENEDKIIKDLANKITEHLNANFDPKNFDNQPLFQYLISTEAIRGEIQQAEKDIEQRNNELLAICTKKQTELQETYLDFLVDLCMVYGPARFSSEVVNSLRDFFEMQETVNENSEIIKKETSYFKNISAPSDETQYEKYLDEITATTQKLNTSAELIKKLFPTYKKNKAFVDRYFTFDNSDVIQFFNEDISTRFEIIKKVSTMPVFLSKKKTELKVAGQYILNLYEELTKIKTQTTDNAIQKNKFTSFLKIIVKNRDNIAKELLKTDKYQEVLPDTHFPEIDQYISIKKQLQETIDERNSVLANYNTQYKTYLSSTFIKDSILFGKDTNAI